MLKRNKNGVALIIVIFAMMLLSMLGWTLATMITGNIDANMRSLASERALGVAEAGAQWALLQVNTDAGFRTDSAHGYASGYAEHTLPFGTASGQYRLTCLDGTGADTGKIVIISTGYVPAQANYLAARQVKIAMVPGGALSMGVGCGGTFDWSRARADHSVSISADISAAYYNGDGDATFNELNADYGPSPLLPPGSGTRLIGGGTTTIPMQWYHDNSDCEWPPNPDTAVINNIVDNATNNTTLVVANPSTFFTAIPNTRYQAVRNLDVPVLSSGAWADNGWAVIMNVTNGRTVTVDRNVTSWRGQHIRLARRYATGSTATPAPEEGRNDSGGAGSGINYIGADIVHNRGVVDTVIDLRTNAISWEDVKIICEGDIFIKGSQSFKMEHSSSGGSHGNRHPPLATQNGNIICLEATTANNRQISGLIFSETGLVNWNYLKYPPIAGANWLRGNMIYAEDIILDGDITIEWLPALVPPEQAQFGAGTASYSWQEQ